MFWVLETHLGEVLIAGKSQKKKPNVLFPKDNSEVKDTVKNVGYLREDLYTV